MDIKEKLVISAQSVLDKKALAVLVLDVKEVSSFTDYLLICSGRSERQVQAIATSIAEDLKKAGILPLGIEGFNAGKWVLMDYSDIIVHIFYEPVRVFYDIEGLWSEVPRFEISEPVSVPF